MFCFFIWSFDFIDFIFYVIRFYLLLAHYVFLLLDFNFFSSDSLIFLYASLTYSFLTLIPCDFETLASRSFVMVRMLILSWFRAITLLGWSPILIIKGFIFFLFFYLVVWFYKFHFLFNWVLLAFCSLCFIVVRFQFLF